MVSDFCPFAPRIVITLFLKLLICFRKGNQLITEILALPSRSSSCPSICSVHTLYILGYVYTIPDSYCAGTKTLQDRDSFTHMSGDFGAISAVTERSSAGPIFNHIGVHTVTLSDRFLCRHSLVRIVI